MLQNGLDLLGRDLERDRSERGEHMERERRSHTAAVDLWGGPGVSFLCFEFRVLGFRGGGGGGKGVWGCRVDDKPQTPDPPETLEAADLGIQKCRSSAAA